MEFLVKHESELPNVAKELIHISGPKKIWLFSGQMGAGKTTLIKEICKQLNVVSGLSSPTFSIVNEYNSSSGEKIFHFDLYRLKNERELLDIGFDEYLFSSNYCFIEWPESGNSFYPNNCFKVQIVANGNERIIKAE